MKEEKVIAICEEGVKVHGVNEEDIIPWIIHALVECFHKQMGPINRASAGKKVIDVLMEERMMERMNVLWELFEEVVCSEDDDYDDDEDD